MKVCVSVAVTLASLDEGSRSALSANLHSNLNEKADFLELQCRICGCGLSLWCACYIYVGLASSDTYMKLAKEQELERQSRRNKKLAKQRTAKSGKRRRHGAAPAADDDHDDDVPVMHVVSTAIDVPEVDSRAS